jgi:predicted dienelactone hydrolase
VAAMGLSFGGYTALAMGGARIDMEAYRTWCEATAEPRVQEYQATLKKVGEMAALAGLDAVPEGPWPSLADRRVDVIVPIVPGARLFGETGGNTVTVPTLMIAAGDDPECPPKENAFPVYRGISARKALIVFHGTHGVNGGKVPVAWAAAMPEYGY